MAVKPFFSLTPNSPNYYSDDVRAFLFTYGGATGYSDYNRLARQYDNNEIIIGHDPVLPGDVTINDITADITRRCAIYIPFRTTITDIKKQFLLLFALRGIYYSQAQFFIGTDCVLTEPISGDEQVAILMDNPGNTYYIRIYIRLASDKSYATMAFKGVDCYLL